jgi:hypothetical protein
VKTANDVALAEIQFMRAHLKHRAILCIGMVAGGVICLVAGVVMLAVGLKGSQVVWLQSATLKVTAGGFGALTLLASVAWGYVAYRSRPQILYLSKPIGGPGTHREFSQALSRLNRE